MLRTFGFDIRGIGMDFDLLVKAFILLVVCPAFVIWGIIFLVNRHKNKQVMADSAKEIHDEKGVNGKQIVSITIVALFVASILYLVISFKNEPNDIKSTATTTATTQTAIISDNPTEEDIIDRSLEVTYDSLQEFYVNFPIDVSYTEAQDYIYNCGLPYSEEKYNGSRVFQISTTKEGTAQKYNKSGLPYIEVHYHYPKNENSANDILEKYKFESINYIPKGYFSFSYEKALGATYRGIIKRLGTDIEYDLSREDQIIFYYQYKDDKWAFS